MFWLTGPLLGPVLPGPRHSLPSRRAPPGSAAAEHAAEPMEDPNVKRYADGEADGRHFWGVTSASGGVNPCESDSKFTLNK